MLRFSLGKIPVQVQWGHLIFPVLIGFSSRPTSLSPAWPDRILGDAAHPQYSQTLFAFVASWVAIVFVSVLIHELGHATMALVYGYRPSVELLWMGGHTLPGAPGPLPWHRDVLLTLAGPTFGFLLAVVGGVGWKLAPELSAAEHIFRTLFLVNVVWSIFNLLPIVPMDGGRIASAVLQRVFGRVGFLFAQVLALALIGVYLALMAFFPLLRQPLTAMIFALWGFGAVTRIQAYRRGELPEKEEASPADVRFAQAAQLFKDGKHEEAQKLGEAMLGDGATGADRSRAHHLLGWIALKDGAGARALQHFGLVEGSVEGPALAAAFSLAGEDDKALPLWELAYRETKDPTVLHEWAGTLIRLDRDAEAEKLTGVTLPAAYQCAERVLFLRKEYAAAGMMGEKAHELRPSAHTAYDAACAFARAGRNEDALRLLRSARAAGFKDWAHAGRDPDLEGLRSHPEYRAISAPG